MANGWLDKDPLINYKARRTQVERPYLNEAEIQTMYNKAFVSEGLNQVRDISIETVNKMLGHKDI